MKEVYGDRSNSPLTTEAAEILFRTRDTTCYNQEYNCSKPIIIYSSALRLVVVRFRRLLELLEMATAKVQANDKKAFHSLDNESLEEAMDALFDSICEYNESCLRVLRCYYSKDKKIKNLKIPKLFQKKVKPFRDFVAKRVNHVKHNGGKVCMIMLTDTNGPHLGYFFEGPNEKGILGTDPIIHPRNGANSFAWTLRYLFKGVYSVGSALASAIGKLREQSKEKLDSGAILGNDLFLLACRLIKLERQVFIEEEKLPWPSICVFEENGLRILSFADTTEEPNRIENQFQVSSTFGHYYGVMKHEYRMPYAREKR